MEQDVIVALANALKGCAYGEKEICGAIAAAEIGAEKSAQQIKDDIMSLVREAL